MRFPSWVLVATAIFVVGCRARQVPPPAGEAHIMSLARAYTTYVSTHQGKGPPSEQAFRDYLKGLPAEKARALGVDSSNLDALFTSPRDGKPYKVVYGFDQSSGRAGSGPPVFAYEQDGTNGKRYVAYFGGKVEEVDASKEVPK
jgi:hypothetical protein